MSNEILRDIWNGGRGLDLTQEQSAEEKDIFMLWKAVMNSWSRCSVRTIGSFWRNTGI
ncbi:MAG: hypothetical protein K2F67_02525 [Eubacterium sp.]|nr:hypothetical protein [Eubacterium sp.]MDE6766810.1 hypothetical protein [Eubacterium sp.]